MKTIKIHYGIDALDIERAVISIGSYDGVHKGHQQLLSQLDNMASRLDAERVVVTFEPHPRIAMGRTNDLQLLTSIEERALLLERYGVDRLVVAHFDDSFRSLPYRDFVREVLLKRLNMVGMVVGYNHRFGRDGEGNYATLVELAEEFGFEVECVEQYLESGDKVSSTVLRNIVYEGAMSRAEEMLGHPYVVVGEACDGKLCVDDSYKLLPLSGNYAALVNGVNCCVTVSGRIINCGNISGRVVVEFK